MSDIELRRLVSQIRVAKEKFEKESAYVHEHFDIVGA